MLSFISYNLIVAGGLAVLIILFYPPSSYSYSYDPALPFVIRMIAIHFLAFFSMICLFYRKLVRVCCCSSSFSLSHVFQATANSSSTTSETDMVVGGTASGRRGPDGGAGAGGTAAVGEGTETLGGGPVEMNDDDDAALTSSQTVTLLRSDLDILRGQLRAAHAKIAETVCVCVFALMDG